MNDDARWKVRLLAANLAFIVGGLHLLMGIRYWLLYARGGFLIPPDARVPLWTISGLAIFVGMAAIYWRLPRRPIYALGAGMMAAYIVGYFSWHLGGHGKFYLGGQPDLHGVSLSTYLIDHFFAGPLATTTLVLEAVLLVVLVVLFLDEP